MEQSTDLESLKGEGGEAGAVEIQLAQVFQACKQPNTISQPGGTPQIGQTSTVYQACSHFLSPHGINTSQPCKSVNIHHFCALTEKSLSFYNREPMQVLMGAQETNVDIAQLNSSVQEKQRGHLDVSM